MCILFVHVYALLKVASYYYLSVFHVNDGFAKKKVWMGVGGWSEIYPSVFWIFGIFLTLQSPLYGTLGTHSSDCNSEQNNELFKKITLPSTRNVLFSVHVNDCKCHCMLPAGGS